MQAAKNAITAAVEVESELRMDQEARIVELEALLEAAHLEVRPLPLLELCSIAIQISELARHSLAFRQSPYFTILEHNERCNIHKKSSYPFPPWGQYEDAPAPQYVADHLSEDSSSYLASKQ